MSSSGPPGGGRTPLKEEKKEKSFTKLLTRARTILKREGSSKRGSGSGLGETEAPKEPPKAAAPPQLTSAQAARARYEGLQGVSRLSKAALFEERAKKLGERYGLEIKTTDWKTITIDPADDTVLRVNKPIRMRVRRTCHRCEANFTTTKECPSCQHTRCVKCTRYPPRRTEEEKIASRERRAELIRTQKENAPLIVDYRIDQKPVVLKKPSKTGGQDLIYKKPRQRVRRNCHECARLFPPGSKTCEGCGHIRCTDCPRDPPKKDKYPLGYPGDEFGPSSVPHFECHSCKTLYPPGSENGTKCKSCGQEKTAASVRARPRKVEPEIELDPAILEKIEARLQALRVS
ncbi:unnamed protein product [Clonostachys rhizophaga]|uniref:Uncharacterized protein n=1 Tax=Clonostachys rhizophaga TaxID=160324 RepID=A0A9N9VFD5_9HYPO|nr:unnamed protein product [Clonostachys rhizophaga]